MHRAFVVAALALAACKGVPVTSPAKLEALTGQPGSFLQGPPVALGASVVLNREDFVYDARLSPDAKRAAVSRLGMKDFHLALHATADGHRLSDTAVNPLEFDVEMVEFSPDGATVATVSRDGALRLYAADSGALISAWLTEEPLVSVAWAPDGSKLVLGGARGLVTLVSYPQLTHLAEARPHSDEVRGVAFTPAGELLTTGWDKKLLAWSVAVSASPAREVRTHITRKNGIVSFRAVVGGKASATLALDARSPMVTVKASLAQAIGLDPLLLTETAQVPTAFGPQVVKVARKQRLAVKNLQLEDVDLAVCDVCAPPETQGVLGGPALEQLSFAFDESSQEIVFTPSATALHVSLGSPVTLQLARAFTLPAPVNDLSLDAAGRVVGLALSETKAERNKAVYDREKRGEVEPEREWDCGARVDVQTGRVLSKVHGHRGVVATAAISPDGQTLATGGWDKRVVVHGASELVDASFGWAVRRVRFSRDGRWLITAAWTPQNPLNDHQSNPAAVVTEVVY